MLCIQLISKVFETNGAQPPHQSKILEKVGARGAIPLLQQGFPPPYSRLSPRSPHVQVQSIGSPRNTDALVGAVFGIRPERKPGQRADAHLVAPYPERGPVHGAGRYTNLIVAPKGFVFGEREELFRWEGNEKTCTAISAPSSSSLQEEDKILFGLRPCDTYGLAYMDRFFLGEHHDINYHLRRQHVFIVAVNCLEAGPECYCASMGTGPFAGNHRPHRIRDAAGKG